MPLSLRTTLLVVCLFSGLTYLLPSGALAGTGGSSTTTQQTGGVSPTDPRFAPTKKGKIVAGLAVPPAGAPPEVVNVINAANQIVKMPYRYGGGHQSFTDSAYDCSGSVSFALHGANFVTSPLDSS
jgi:cell wall-associated NlpC family hydrolase